MLEKEIIMSLYEELGGRDAITAVVAIFYRKMLGDERVSDFFDSVDMDKQMAKQTAFLSMVTGGPNEYTGKDMRTVHAPLVAKGLNDSHVDIVIEHLGAALKSAGVSDEKIANVAKIANSVRSDVLCK